MILMEERATHRKASVHAFGNLPELDPAGDGYRLSKLVRTDTGISWTIKTDSLHRVML
jgi:hypothetical protein